MNTEQNTNRNSATTPQPIPGVKHVILIASGKGGVGKSTLAINLATALAKTFKVGLLDADIYGPSIPRMMGAIGQRPVADDSGKIQPLIRYGVKVMSIGFLIEDASSVIWRGPMLFKAIDQFLYDTEWGDLDYLIVDLPPGTGDVQLTLSQKIPLTGAIVVTTPQNVALADAKKAIDMFERTHVPIIGVIENMSYFKNPVTQEKIQLYPPGDLDAYLDSKHIIKIGEIPFNPQISLSCETGFPLMWQDADQKKQAETQEFFDICEHIQDLLMDEKPLYAHFANVNTTATLETQNSTPPVKTKCSTNCGCAN